ncbi:MBL fold metallo-hydrolase [Verrucomicrobiota bacterium]
MTADICIHPWDYAVEPFRIAGPLYYVGNKNVSSHLIDTGKGLILLDTTYPQTAYLLLESIRRLGFDPADLHTIIHSHGHYDHFGGTRAIVELTGARTAMGEDDAFILTERPELSWAPEYGVEFHETFGLDLALRDGQTVELGNVEIECVHIPGHTPGSMSFFFSVAEDKDYTVGIHGGPGLNTLTDKYLKEYGLSHDARHRYQQSLQKLKDRTVDIFIGAHPCQNDTFRKQKRMTSGNNPFVDRKSWSTFLARQETKAYETFGMANQSIQPTP